VEPSICLRVCGGVCRKEDSASFSLAHEVSHSWIAVWERKTKEDWRWLSVGTEDGPLLDVGIDRGSKVRSGQLGL